jgi:hypothetical protein
VQDFTLLAHVSGTTVQMAAVLFVGRTRPCTVLYLCLVLPSRHTQTAGHFCYTSNCKVLLHYEFSFHYQEKLYIVSANMSNALLIKICSGVSLFI